MEEEIQAVTSGSGGVEDMNSGSDMEQTGQVLLTAVKVEEPVCGKRRQKLILTEEVEDSLIEWIKKTPCLYTKGMRDYRDTKKRTKLWSDKAVELDLSVEGLQCWWKSVRTRFGKLTATPVEDEVREHTDRDKYILEKLWFIKKHIARIPSRKNCILRARAGPSTPTATFSHSTSPGSPVLQEEKPHSKEDSTEPVFSTTSVCHIPSKRMRKSTSVESCDSEESIQVARVGNEGSQKPLGRIEKAIPQCTVEPDVRQSWGQWLVAGLKDIHPSLWKDFTDQTYKLWNNFADHSRSIRYREEQQGQMGL